MSVQRQNLNEYAPNADWTPSGLRCDERIWIGSAGLPACNLSAAALAAIASIGSGCLMMCARVRFM
jgi:hypothetical protein